MANRFDVGDTVDGTYRVLGELGAGGMGAVLLVEADEGQFLALKYCNSEEPEYRRRFGREVRVMQSITHSNVMPVVASNVEYDHLTLSCPLRSGVSLTN
jgi:serine/threonine protein kinase